MVKVIAFFNHKGGVGKTTTVYNLGYGLAKLGQKVLLIDADSQMNLTASVYGLATDSHYGNNQTSLWKEFNNKYTSFSTVLESFINKTTINISAYDYNKHNTSDKLQGNINLLRGDLALDNFGVNILTLIKNNNPLTRGNIVSIASGLDTLYKNYDFVLIDQSPSSSSILNGILALTSTYVIVPAMPTFFCLQAVNNLQDIWISWLDTLGSFASTTNQDGFDFKSKFLGVIIQQGKKYNNKDAKYTEDWKKLVNNGLYQFLNHPKCRGYSIDENYFYKHFLDQTISNPFIIGTYFNFTQLRSIAEKKGMPVIKLQAKDLPNEKSKVAKQQTYKNLHKHLIDTNEYICKCLISL